MSSESKTFGAGVDNTVYLGFANLPNQVHRKSVKKGFEFTLMVVGDSGLGKSTLINALFYSQLYKDRKIPAVQDLNESTVKIKPVSVDIEEKGVKLKLTVVDTPGMNDNDSIVFPLMSSILIHILLFSFINTSSPLLFICQSFHFTFFYRFWGCY